jgi:hypothetical protein
VEWKDESEWVSAYDGRSRGRGKKNCKEFVLDDTKKMVMSGGVSLWEIVQLVQVPKP